MIDVIANTKFGRICDEIAILTMKLAKNPNHPKASSWRWKIGHLTEKLSGMTGF
jgi:hypothetical protein